ncbi:hypothetical protein [Micromonospora peucetia]|uniref:hypothetical protein n=1 Tax=Micromonospora peucetia TaxID=47871 RepID=UPI00114C9B35|nr:hypothetical protein [Micromonospora peucetia]
MPSDLAWLAADRAMSAAGGDPRRAGLAAVSLAQALRALRRGRLAMTAAVTAVHQLDLAPSGVFLPDEPALTGTLLIEAALAAAACGSAELRRASSPSVRLTSPPPTTSGTTRTTTASGSAPPPSNSPVP